MKTIFKILIALAVIALIVAAVLVVGHFLGWFHVDTTLKGDVRTESFTDSKNLQIEVGTAAVIIVPGETLSFETDHKYVNAKIEGDTLIVKEDQNNIGLNVTETPYVKVTVPTGKIFEEANVKTGAGKVTGKGLAANVLKLDLGAGSVEFEDLYGYDRTTINTGAGSFKVNGGELSKLDLSLGAGSANLRSRLMGSSAVECGVGGVTLNLIGTESDYTVTFKKGIGKATIAGVSAEEGKTYGDGPSEVRVHGGVGSIEVTYTA